MTDLNHAAADLRIADFDYELPASLIAQTPIEPRDASRLLVVERATGRWHHAALRDLPEWLQPGDLIVANNSRVLPARLRAERSDTGGKVELLLLTRIGGGRWRALAKPSRRLRPGGRLVLRHLDGTGPGAWLTVMAVGDAGQVEIGFDDGDEVPLQAFGTVPLPPYIRTPLTDPERYQTVYATVPGSAAAPTAGLHVTPELRERLQARGVGWAEVTLHVGLDTFRPVTAETVGGHVIHREWCEVSEEAAGRIAETRGAGGRVVALGTTSARTLETLGVRGNPDRGGGFGGWTDLFIVPGHRWSVVDGLVTNFHLPRSSLLLLVSALIDWPHLRSAYEEAIAQEYRFFSFGDAMLVV